MLVLESAAADLTAAQAGPPASATPHSSCAARRAVSGCPPIATSATTRRSTSGRASCVCGAPCWLSALKAFSAPAPCHTHAPLVQSGCFWDSGSSPPPPRCLHECLHAARVAHIRAVSILGAAEPLRTGSCPKQFVAIYSNHPESKLHQPRTRANAHPRVLLHMRGERLQRRQQARQVRPMAPDWHVHAAGSPLSAPRHRQLNPAGASAAAACCRRSLLQLYARPASTGRSASTKDVVPFKRQPPVTKRHAPGSCSCCRGCVSPLLAAARAACAWPFAAASVTSAGCRPAASPRNGGARSVYSARLVKTEITNFIY